jgi:rod shape-determining protein MreB and related proteins
MFYCHFAQIIYVQVSANQLTVRDPKTGESFTDTPEIAITNDHPNYLSMGNDARAHESLVSIKIIKPFAHPRSMASSCTLGEAVLKAFILRIKRRSVLSLGLVPTIIMHLMDIPIGGFTEVEARVFYEMAISAGETYKSKVTVWQGQNLSDQELLSGKFPSSSFGKVLMSRRDYVDMLS